MDVTTNIGILFGNDPWYNCKGLQFDLTTVNPYVSTNLETAARQSGKYLADAVEQKIDEYPGSFSASYSLPPLARLPGVHVIIKELVIQLTKSHKKHVSADDFLSCLSGLCPSAHGITSSKGGRA